MFGERWDRNAGELLDVVVGVDLGGNRNIKNESSSGSILSTMDGRKRADVHPGARVLVVQKQDQRSGKTTEGVVSEILTNSSTHPYGIKVRLEDGVVGRVKEILE